MKYLLLVLFIGMTMNAQAQDSNLPYDTIPTYPVEITEGAVLARFIDGLGFRFRWSAEGLTEKDYDYRPTPEARSTRETISHLYDLSVRIVNAATHTVNTRGGEKPVSMDETIRLTLENFSQAANIFKEVDDLSPYKIKNEGRDIDLWYLMNGPINDATWHCGQLASFRRTSGNPINPKVNHFLGNIRD